MQSRLPEAVDIDGVAAALRARVEGEVRFDEGDRALYSADASNYRQVPYGVVIPGHDRDVVAAVEVCRQAGVPILSRGGGTSQNGQCCNLAVVLDYSKYMNRVLEIDPRERTALVEPGVVCDALKQAVEPHGLTFGPDPGTHSRCTIGGMIGNNSCGAHSVVAGKTDDNVCELEVLTYSGDRFWVGATDDATYHRIVAAGGPQGRIYQALRALADRYGDLIRERFPGIRRRVSGYNLDQLLPENGFNVARALVGTEGTCVAVLKARTRLIANPRVRVLLVLGYPDICVAADATPALMAFHPSAVEGIDNEIAAGLRRRGICADGLALLPPGEAWLFVEFAAASLPEARAAGEAALAAARRERRMSGAVLLERAAEQKDAWSVRETGASPNHRQGDEPEMVAGWEDAAVDPARLGDYLRDYRTLLGKFGYRSSLFGHFGDGCIHGRVNFDLRSTQGVDTWRDFLLQAAELVVRYGGSLSGEHGDGQAKGELLPLMFGDELMQAFREFRRIWDPEAMMNPGKLVDSYRVDENLRMGPDYRPRPLATRFAFAVDDGSFVQATERCNGTAKCRNRHAAGLMCPSFRATGEERYSTRGRSRMLFELARGDFLRDAWDNEALRDSLEHCLACKGCKSECPTAVDMASYKAEFFSHYHELHRRSREKYLMATIGDWLPLAARLPRLNNWLTGGWGLRSLSRLIAGTASRPFPPLAPQTFRRWFGARNARRASEKSVVLWPDTFNNHYHPESARAAVELLERAGFTVLLPEGSVCCGRPLYDAGMLDRARQRLLRSLAALEPFLKNDIPVVGLEPACLSVFRGESLELLGHDSRARKLSEQIFLLGEFLEREGFQPPAGAGGPVIVHGHCHHKSEFDFGADLRLLSQAGFDCSQPEPGCCGMAGGFGYSPRTYPVSMAIGEQALLPAVRAAAPDTAVVANGFSCREQIRQATGRAPLHLAELLRAVIDPKDGRDAR